MTNQSFIFQVIILKNLLSRVSGVLLFIKNIFQWEMGEDINPLELISLELLCVFAWVNVSVKITSINTFHRFSYENCNNDHVR